MPSPFPGMDPYLEKPSVWHDFHNDLLIKFRGLLAAQVRPAFIVQTDDHVYLHELSAEERLGPRVGLAAVGDVTLKGRPGGAGTSGGATAVATTPTTSLRLSLPGVIEQRETYLKVLDRETREVVTVIELLSPTNKRPGSTDRNVFLAKRARLLGTTANYVEVDLLRGGDGPPIPDAPAGDYRATVSRPPAEGLPDPLFGPPRPPADVWVWGLRDTLPVLPVPLRPPHPDALLDLRAALDRTYDEACYEDYLHAAPPDPPLDDADATWAAGVLGAGPAAG